MSSRVGEPKTTHTLVPLYNIDPQTGARVEIFYADRALAASFGGSGGGASPAFCRGRADWPICQQLCPTAIPDAHAALKGLEKTANAGR